MRVRLTVSLERGRRCRAPFFSVWTVSRMCTRYAHVQCTRTSQLSPLNRSTLRQPQAQRLALYRVQAISTRRDKTSRVSSCWPVLRSAFYFLYTIDIIVESRGSASSVQVPPSCPPSRLRCSVRLSVARLRRALHGELPRSTRSRRRCRCGLHRADPDT